MKHENAWNRAYRLYALRPVPDSIARSAAARFQRMTPGYILVYAQKSPGGEAVEVTKEEIHRLSRRDQAWLYDCLMLLTRERLEQNEAETEHRLHDLVARLEVELEKEARKGRNGKEEST